MIITSWVTRGLRPGDEVHIPRWLDELRGVVERVAYCQRFAPGVDQRRLPPADPNHARWLDG